METSQATASPEKVGCTGGLSIVAKTTRRPSRLGGQAFPFAGARKRPSGTGKRNFLKKAEQFDQRFEEKYGIGASARFRKIIEDPDTSLSDAARQFGFSREYARQIYRKFYGCAYTKVCQDKRRQRKKQRLETKVKASARLQALATVRQKLQSMGMAVLVVRERSTFQIIADGCILSLRLSSSFITVGEKKYRRINLSKNSPTNRCNFFVCVFCSSHRCTHYIIPARRMPKGGFSVAEEATEKKSKYAVYKEAWHLLPRKRRADSPWKRKNPGRINPYSKLTHPNPISKEIETIIVERFAGRSRTAPDLTTTAGETLKETNSLL